MSKKYKSTNVSEVEEHISLKYEVKKRLGKGVSVLKSLKLKDSHWWRWVNCTVNETLCIIDKHTIYKLYFEIHFAT